MHKSTDPHIIIAGGGTGGHVIPALALADAIRTQYPSIKVTFIGAKRGLEAKLMPERGEEILLLPMHSIQGASVWQKIRVLAWELPHAIWTIRNHWKEKPALMIGVGGYASVTGILAAITRGVPILLYEQNGYPGLVNRTLSRFCQGVLLGFSEAKHHLPPSANCVVTGNIIRKELLTLYPQRITHHPLRILITGGSQGARIFNETVPKACAQLKAQGTLFTVTHITGKQEGALESVAQAYHHAGVEAEVLPFCTNMAAFYASGDILIARSGAMTLCEAAAVGIATIFVPLPHAADDHQTFNAKTLSDHQAAILLPQYQFTHARLAEILTQLLHEHDHRLAMGACAYSLAPLDAKEKQLQAIAHYISTTSSSLDPSL
ncbi:MAG: undecaprenyldiphospho-muramoylpentapeptide beta-N-acetylglucosaminyltransferase [Zetaproteobacteria bacterium]|nr:undecaprenyldiphospho-muramoylpentapeptide beta-N-acetylglucosaminyltransferase [Zetaproteobacteria bacterium]